MEHLAHRIEIEKQMRELLQANDLPQPDRVEYGVACVRFFFDAVRRVVVVDLDSDEQGAPGPSGAG
jgi:hypothetical protein